MIKYFFVLFLCCGAGSLAQLPVWALLPVPEALKKNAHSIKREEQIELDIKSPSKIGYTVHRVITIWDDAGSDELVFAAYTDKFISLENVQIQLYDALGKLLKKYGKNEIYTQSSGEGLVPDGKINYLKITAQSYPVTIMMDYNLKYSGLCDYPDYEIQVPGQSTENALFTVKVAADSVIRYKLQNTVTAPEISTSGKYKTYNWSFKNIPALKYEEGSVSRESRYPKIIVAPNKFSLDGYEGDMSTWQNFGKWYGSLAKEASNLTEQTKLKLVELVKDAVSEKDKIRIIYHFLQQNFRYVSIQLGIGGFKPFDADFVDKKKYGDCKALSNYTQACLSAVGIKSYQALINAAYNKEAVDPNFPNNSFNHVILCVPMQKDSVWLECTSNTNDFGVLGNFTENRNALLITEDGGKLVATPKSKAADNLFSCKTIVTILENGNGNAVATLYSSGEYKQDVMHYIANEKKDDQKIFLIQYLGFIPPDDFVLEHDKTSITGKTEIKMNIEKIPDFTAGDKFFLSPRIYKLWSMSMPKSENRSLDFYFGCPFIKTDTTIYILPKGFTIETLPKQKNLQFDYGSFNTTCFFNEKDNTVTTTARLALYEYKIPVAKYTATEKFFNDVLEEFGEKIVIKKL